MAPHTMSYFAPRLTAFLQFGLLTVTSAQQFSDSTIAVEYPGLSDSCSTALNTTLQCSSILGIVSIDNAYLSSEELTVLCTDECSQSLSDVKDTIQQACTADTDVIVDGGVAYPATWVLDHFVYTFNTSCARDSSTEEYCDTLIQSWTNASTSLTDEQACSECMLRIAQIELESPFDYDNDTARDFASTTSSCGATGYAVIPPSSYALNGTAAVSSTATTSTTAASATTSTCSSSYIIKDGDDCNSIASAQNVSTFGLTYSNNLNAYCSDIPETGSELCLPDPCDIYTVQTNDTCLTVIQNQTNDITVTQLQTWNPNINRVCGNLNRLNGTVICVSPPGGFLQLGLTTTATMTAAATTAAAPSNVQPGTNIRCGRYYTIQAGDYCSLVTVEFGISLDNFYFLNPEINSTDCSNLALGQAYCVEAVGSISTYANYSGAATANACTGASAASTCFVDVTSLADTPLIAGDATLIHRNVTASSTSSVATQTSMPHAPDTVDGCYTYTNYRAENSTSGSVSANNCTLVAALYRVTVSDLIAWNPSLETGSNCALQLGYSYCVQKAASVVNNATVGTCISVTSTMAGTSSSCSCYTTIYGFDSGDYDCNLLASDYSLTVSELISLNSWINNSNCTTGLYADLVDSDSRAVCIGTGGTTPSITSSAGASTTTTATVPTQTGITSNCQEFYTAQSGDSCAAIEETYDITFAELYAWNPALGSNCENLYVGFAYCVDGPATTSTTTTSTAAAAAPTQTGITSDCTELYTVQSGDGCAAIDEKYGITFQQFYEWNPAVGDDCQNLWVGYGYCVSTS